MPAVVLSVRVRRELPKLLRASEASPLRAQPRVTSNADGPELVTIASVTRQGVPEVRYHGNPLPNYRPHVPTLMSHTQSAASSASRFQIKVNNALKFL